MPQPGKSWRHAIISTHGSWLPGDARGWRCRKHRIHSSGDYRNPPPPEEHAGLRKYCEFHSAKTVRIPRQLRATIGQAMIEYLTSSGHRVLVVSVGVTHAHLLVELPSGLPDVKRTMGDCKCKSSRAVKKELPGKVWADGGDYRLVRSRSHLVAAFHYIQTQQEEGAWIWSFREGRGWGNQSGSSGSD